MYNLFSSLNINKSYKVHLIGIGGIGMSAIAQLLHSYGYLVQGSDTILDSNTDKLIKLGIRVFLGHFSNNINDANLVIYSSAIKDDNVELVSAIKEQKYIMHRADVIAQLSQLKRTIAISGSHGKTTTTAMISSIFDSANLDHTLIIGGMVNKYNNNIKIGSGDWLIVEADESDGSMIHIIPEVVVITNIDNEHLDYYKSANTLENHFYEFLNKISKKGFVVLPKNILQNNKLQCRSITYGFTESEFIALNIRQCNYQTLFDIIFLYENGSNVLVRDICLAAIGNHNVYNALAAIVVAIRLGISIAFIKKGLVNFSGVQRRFSLIAETKTVKFFDDYAHHPTEIEASLMSAKSVTKGRVICIIQPHRFTRVRDFFDQFVEVLIKFDCVIMMNVYSASEEQISGFTSNDLSNNIVSQGFDNIFQADDVDSITLVISKMIQKYDSFLFVGAGNITKVAYKVAKNIKMLHDNI